MRTQTDERTDMMELKVALRNCLRTRLKVKSYKIAILKTRKYLQTAVNPGSIILCMYRILFEQWTMFSTMLIF
jgi:hypothetical protein